MSISRNNSTDYAAREKYVMPIIKRHCVNSQFLHFGRSSRGDDDERRHMDDARIFKYQSSTRFNFDIKNRRDI